MGSQLLNTWYNLPQEIQDTLTAIDYTERTPLPIFITEKSYYVGDKDWHYTVQDLKRLIMCSYFAGITGDGRMRFTK